MGNNSSTNKLISTKLIRYLLSMVLIIYTKIHQIWPVGTEIWLWSQNNIPLTLWGDKKGLYSVTSLQIISKFELDLYFTMLYPSENFEWNECIPSKVILIGNKSMTLLRTSMRSAMILTWTVHHPHLLFKLDRKIHCSKNTCT